VYLIFYYVHNSISFLFVYIYFCTFVSISEGISISISVFIFCSDHFAFQLMQITPERCMV